MKNQNNERKLNGRVICKMSSGIAVSESSLWGSIEISKGSENSEVQLLPAGFASEQRCICTAHYPMLYTQPGDSEPRQCGPYTAYVFTQMHFPLFGFFFLFFFNISSTESWSNARIRRKKPVSSAAWKGKFSTCDIKDRKLCFPAKDCGGTETGNTQACQGWPQDPSGAPREEPAHSAGKRATLPSKEASARLPPGSDSAARRRGHRHTDRSKTPETGHICITTWLYKAKQTRHTGTCTRIPSHTHTHPETHTWSHSQRHKSSHQRWPRGTHKDTRGDIKDTYFRPYTIKHKENRTVAHTTAHKPKHREINNTDICTVTQ